MSEMNKHLEKIIEMTSFKYSKKYIWLSESSKYKFEKKLEYHVNQFSNQFVEIFRPLYDYLQLVFDSVNQFISSVNLDDLDDETICDHCYARQSTFMLNNDRIEYCGYCGNEIDWSDEDESR